MHQGFATFERFNGIHDGGIAKHQILVVDPSI